MTLLQVYKGLDIVTNKVTEEEKRQAKHHLLDFLNPNQHYSVVHFRDNALPIVSFNRSTGIKTKLAVFIRSVCEDALEKYFYIFKNRHYFRGFNEFSDPV